MSVRQYEAGSSYKERRNRRWSVENAWLSYTEAEEKELETVAKAYRNFLNVGKTERECVTEIVKEAQEAGYESLEEKVARGDRLKAGDKGFIQ